jgi:hypothetical protein
MQAVSLNQSAVYTVPAVYTVHAVSAVSVRTISTVLPYPLCFLCPLSCRIHCAYCIPLPAVFTVPVVFTVLLSDCCPAVPGPGSNLASPQPTADRQSPGGLPPGMALGCGLTSVRGNRGENYENKPLVRQETNREKKSIAYIYCACCIHCACCIYHACCIHPLYLLFLLSFVRSAVSYALYKVTVSAGFYSLPSTARNGRHSPLSELLPTRNCQACYVKT